MKSALASPSLVIGVLLGVACSSTGSKDSSGGTGGAGTSTSTTGSAGGQATTSSSTTGSSTTSTSGGTAFVPKHVFTIILENHDYNEIVGSTNAPYINSLIASYGLATNYMDSGTHPSLPNYLYMTSGATQYPGGTNLLPTPTPSLGTFPVNAANLGNQLQVAGVPWRSYQESMGTACALADSGEFACKHDPFLYFTDIQSGANGLCAQTNVDFSNFAADLAADTYRYMWITPNLLDDGHDPSATAADIVTALTDSDTWLSMQVPTILASAAYKDGGVLFITWDEAEGRNGDSKDQVPMIIVTEGIKSPGYKSAVAYSHASFLGTVENIFGLPKLGAAMTAATMEEFWQ